MTYSFTEQHNGMWSRKIIVMLTWSLLFFSLVAYAVLNIVHRHTASSIYRYPKNESLNTPRIDQPDTRRFDYNWTILLTVNEGFRDFFSNWWWHFQRLGINVPIIVVTEDETSYSKLQEEFRSRHKYSVTVLRSSVLSVSQAARHGTADYKKIVSARPIHILDQLEAGVDLLYADIDTVWLKDPFPYFKGTYDMWIEQEYGSIYCTGFMAIISNNKTINLVRDWKKALIKSPQLNQPTFNRLLKASAVKFKPLNETVFPHGPDFNNFNEQRRSRVVVMHNTYIYGHHEKIERFKKLKLWFQIF